MNEECPYCGESNAYHNGVCYYCPDCDREYGPSIDDLFEDDDE